MRLVLGGLVGALALASCAKPFGRVVTHVSADGDQRLIVTSCAMIYDKARTTTKLDDCHQIPIRRSAAPDGVATATAVRPGEIVTAIFERDGGGVRVVSCTFGDAGGGVPTIHDCHESILSLPIAGAQP